MLEARIPYAMYALEPAISEKTLAIHSQLFEGYAESLEKAQNGAKSANTPGSMRSNGADLAFSGSGYVLHRHYFDAMTPGGGFPQSVTKEQLTRRFGSMDAFKQLFTAAGMGILGPGWAVLSYFPPTRSLEIVSVTRHPDNMLAEAVPVLVLDVWEHAYFLDYGKDRASYIAAWWNLVNGRYVENRLTGVMETAVYI